MSDDTGVPARLQAPDRDQVREIVRSKASEYPNLDLTDTQLEVIALEVQVVIAEAQIVDLENQLRREHMARVRAERRAQVPRGEPWKYPWRHNDSAADQ